MSDHLLWVQVPPPRVASETTLTFAVAAVIAIYAIPVVTAVDADTIPVEFHAGDITCCFCGHGDPEPEAPDEEPERWPGEYTMRLEGPVSREAAIEQAMHRITTRHVGILGSTELLRPNFSNHASTIEDGEFFRDDDDAAPWRVRSFPQLAAEMQPPHTSQLWRLTILAQGSLDRRTVRRFLRRQQLELQRCYDPTPSLYLDRTLRGDGDLAMQFLIDRDGRVVQVIPITSSPELATCLEQTVKGLTFPRSDGLTQVHVALRYGTTDASAGGFVR